MATLIPKFEQSGTGAVNRPFTQKLAETVSVKDFGAVGNGVADDTAAIQAALDSQYDTMTALFFPAGTYRITAPLTIWCDNVETSDRFPVVYGEGRSNTIILKTTNTTSTVTNYTAIDAVFIIANSFSKEGNTVTSNTTQSQTAAFYGRLSNMTLESQNTTSSKVANGVYSQGIFFWTFEDVKFHYTINGVKVEWWNVLCNWIRTEMSYNEVAFEFGVTDFGSNSTMYFESVHCNGITSIAYNILGGATLLNCSIDGGTAAHIVCPGIDRGAAGYLTGEVTLYNCHHESQAMASGNNVYYANFGSNITAYDTGITIPYVSYTSSSYIAEATNFSSIHLVNSGAAIPVGASASAGGLYSVDATSTFTVDNFAFNYDDFGVATRAIENVGNQLIVSDPFNNDSATINKFIAYVGGSVPSGQRSVLSTGYSSNRVTFTVVQAYGNLQSNCFMFPTGYDLTNYSKIYISGSVTFTEGSGTGNANYQVVLGDTLIADGTVYAGTAYAPAYTLTPSSELPSNYSDTNFNKFADITDINGTYFIGIILYGQNITSNALKITLER